MRRAIVLLTTTLAWAALTEEAATGQAASKEALAKLVPLAQKDGRLHINQESWEKLKEEEPADPEAARKWKREKLAKRLGRAVENVDDKMLDRMLRGHGGGSVQEELFNDLLASAGGGMGGTSSSSSGTQTRLSASRPNLDAEFSYDGAGHSYALELKEKTNDCRVLSVQEHGSLGLYVRLANPKTISALQFVQFSNGAVSLCSSSSRDSVAVTAENFEELLKAHPDKTQKYLLRPLAEWGIQLPLNPFLPTVVAAACSGFGAAAPATHDRLDALVKKLQDEDAEVRDDATRELVKLFPLAIRDVVSAAQQAPDAETKLRLDKAIAAHPGIARARPYAEEQKLHENRAYLLEVMTRMPFFKAAARARLAELCGKDFGDDPAAWPKP